MKTVAIFCLVVLLPCMWARSIQTEEEDFDITKFPEEVKEFVHNIFDGLKNAVDEIESFDVKRFTLPQAPPPPPPPKPFNINLGHGVDVNSHGLTYTNGNFGAHVIPTYNGGQPGVNFGVHYNW